MSYLQRQNRVKVLAALDRRVKAFRTRERVWPLYAPSEPVSMDEVARQALDGAAYDLTELRARTLLTQRWECMLRVLTHNIMLVAARR